MKNFIIVIFGKIIQKLLKDVPISSVVCEKNRVTIKEGWGGKSIEFFPPYYFFKVFTEGNEARAIRLWEEWYYSRLIEQKLYDIPKSEGGMNQGSLYMLIDEIHHSNGIELKADLSNANKEYITQGIGKRVKQRINLLQSIRQNGYQPHWDCISMIKKDKYYILMEGYHRVAALSVCGYSTVIAATSNLKIISFIKRIIVRILGGSKKYNRSLLAKEFLPED